MILAGDIGATNTRLALFERSANKFRAVAEEKFSSPAFPSLGAIVERFLSGKQQPIESACFGVPGPVTNGVAKITNLPWTVEAVEIERLLRLKSTGLINDLTANAYGLSELSDADFVTLNEGKRAAGNAAIISAGTGLGQAGMFFDDKTGRLRPFGTEGGHADFAPRNEIETELLRYLQRKFGRVSVERAVSGQGIDNIYDFLRDTRREEEPPWLAEEMAFALDKAAVIGKNANSGKAPICERTMQIFVALYGAEAGNLALKMLAVGGVFIGGGIAPKILPQLQTGAFLQSLFDKGRMRELLEAMPVRIVLNDKAALLGAAHYAFYEQQQQSART